MTANDRIYFAQRAAEEQERAIAASDPNVAEAIERARAKA